MEEKSETGFNIEDDEDFFQDLCDDFNEEEEEEDVPRWEDMVETQDFLDTETATDITTDTTQVKTQPQDVFQDKFGKVFY